MTPTHAVLLDAHGTLVELEPPAPLLRRTLAERHGIAIEHDEARRALIAEITYYRAHMHEGTDGASVGDLRARCAEVLRAELVGAAPTLARLSAAEMTAVLLGSLVFRAFADVRPMLRAIRGAGIKAVVASNWDASLEEVLVELGLRSELDAVVSSGAYGAAKPAPEIFAEALRRAGVAADRAVHVGDSLQEDVVGAQAAGITPVLLVRDADGRAPAELGGDGAAPAGVCVIRSLAELTALLPVEPRRSGR